MARLCYSYLNEMIFPLVPKLPKHHWYQGYFYTLHACTCTVVLHCILHCPTTCSTRRRCWYSSAATLHICKLPCTCHNVCLYDTDGAVSMCTNCLHCHPCFPHVAICSYSCRPLFLFVPPAFYSCRLLFMSTIVL